MAKIAQDPVVAIQGVLRSMLSEGRVGAVLVVREGMPALITDPGRCDGADPLAPHFPVSGARLLARLTRKPLPAPIAAVLRPCEVRAVTELVKLKQGSLDGVTLLSFDCLGASAREGELAPACRVCEHPVAEGVDLHFGLLGMEGSLLLEAKTPRGEELLDSLSLGETAQAPPEREAAIARLEAERLEARDRMFAETSAATDSMEKLSEYLSLCVGCTNCRVACPICYCRECAVNTDVFDHEPAQYLRWAKKRGQIRMPTDTVFFHLMRLAHMSLSCVGCGQCSNACPNGIPVMELFRTIAHHTQRAFGYEPGRSVDEPPPLSTFKEGEFLELTGGKD